MTEQPQPSPRYHGDVWGDLPDPFPKSVAQIVYRSLLDAIPSQSDARSLMAGGFKAAAYRWWMTRESHNSYVGVIQEQGLAPGAEGEWEQEAALFSFFAGGLAVLESFSFALHAVGSHFAEESGFPLSTPIQKLTGATV